MAATAKVSIEAIARVCHEVNRAYCASLGDMSQPAWEGAPEWQRESAINGVRFHLKAIAEGRNLKPSDAHESWLAEKRAAGWKYGPVKDVEKKEHPCFLPYDELPQQQRSKDIRTGFLYPTHCDLCRALAERDVKVATQARRQALQDAAKAYCLNCADGIPLSDGKNKMHVGGLYCYSWTIHALAREAEKPDSEENVERVCDLCGAAFRGRNRDHACTPARKLSP